MTPIRSVIISLKSDPDGLQDRRSTESVWRVEFSVKNGSIFIYFVFNKSNFKIYFCTAQKYVFLVLADMSYRCLIHPSIRTSRLSWFSTINRCQSTHHSVILKLTPESLFLLSFKRRFTDRMHA